MPVPKYHGKRLVAQVQVETWQLRIETAVRKAMSEHRASAFRAVRASSLTASAPPDPFDLSTWEQSVAGAVAPVAGSIMDEVAAQVAKSFATSPSPIDMTARVQRLIAKVTEIGPDLAESLGSTLTEGVALGEGISKLADRVQSVFDVGDRQATSIARTEVVGAANGASLDQAQQVASDGAISLVKAWIATNDERTRDTHAEADGQEVGIDETFTVGDCELMHPGDPDGCDEEVWGCRCALVFAEAPTGEDAAPADEG